MPVYEVMRNVAVTKFLGTVTADSDEEALEKAWDEFEPERMGLCHQCSDEGDQGDPAILLISETGTAVDEEHLELEMLRKFVQKVADSKLYAPAVELVKEAQAILGKT